MRLQDSCDNYRTTDAHLQPERAMSGRSVQVPSGKHRNLQLCGNNRSPRRGSDLRRSDGGAGRFRPQVLDVTGVSRGARYRQG